ncbi:hypothetical protein [Ochrobactrum soli]|uniref:hypothetical protein n=1 Tax=Ochrobactrum soli TaxID=2448455 RepID=UPI0011B27D2C|nr:hypothetical protein [[Ochrobactrum] soli]
MIVPFEPDHKQNTFLSIQCTGSMAGVSVRGSGPEVSTPMDFAGTHLNSLSILRLDEPASLQRYNPLWPRALVPLARPPRWENREENRIKVAFENLHPQRRSLSAEALFDESPQARLAECASPIDGSEEREMANSRRWT